ncbi:Methyltransferase domain-containing protein [Streptomyces sp. DvalAA-14]|uniref:class I SAM-dependent methyltransferase n=1 Tax=unclassified Streptomyces TaxID=2593676 RepID=UPI00081B07EB|nr:MULTISPECIES: class I SAM-dependent methyltransferase [unclassified Streptomyces]MYS23788.1 methyltransferase domain-containing protein [Streptomyces sp. SID4948]SCE38705.1 Methyltransferase domain-containing protein [Streptomyces sp. DvalAA-14]
MAPEDDAGTARGRVFGEVAELYDAARPGYSDAMVTEVLAYAALGDRAAVEVGAGTGKATVPFAARGIPLVCVEPDARMAEVLRRNTAGYPNVRVEVGDFEQWQSGGRRYGLLLAASSWHFVDHDRRWDLVHAALAPGGAVALVRNPHGIHDAGLRAELAAIGDRHGVTGSPHRFLASDIGGGEPGSWDQAWPDAECRRDGRFSDRRSVRFQENLRYDTDRYLGYLTSLSAYRNLPSPRREAALAEAGRLLDAHGGGIDLLQATDVFLARAR